MMFALTWLVQLSTAAMAYIPEYSLIASRTADNHGKGAYVIEQDVTYRRDAELYSVKETWLVLGENNLRVSLEGRGPLKGLVQGTMIYEGSLKQFMDGNQLKSQRLGEDWLEPLFHFRNSRYFRSRLVNLKVTPAEALQDRPPLSSDGEPKYEAPSFIRLSRVGGTIAWAIGVPPSVGQAPTVWIQQDQFVLRKYRSANQLTLRADDYAKFDDIWYPKSRTYEFGSYTVQVTTLSVKPAGKLTAADPRFKPASLTAQNAVKLPDPEALREFYARFR